MNSEVAWSKRDAVVLVAIALSVSLFHARGLAPGQAFLPVDRVGNSLPWISGQPTPLQNWLISDPLYQSYPFLVHSLDSLRSGNGWPLWNPSLFMGHPVVADPLAQPFYPVFLALGLLFGAARGLTLGLGLHSVLAATLTYGFLRTLGSRRAGAALGALTYALGGYMVTWFETTFWVSTLSWLPGALWAFELALRRRRWRWVVLAAAALALATLAGQYAFVLTFDLFLGLYALGRSWEGVRRGREGYRWPVTSLAVAIGLGTLLSALQLLPFAEFLQSTHRVATSPLLATLPAQQLITLIVPAFYGYPPDGPYWGELNFSEGTIYASLPALLLACLAPFTARRFFVSYLAAVAVILGLLLTGSPGVQRLASLPVLQYVSLHRAVFLLPLIVACLSAATLSSPKVSWRLSLLLGAALAGAVAVAVYLNWGNAQNHRAELEPPLLQAGTLLAVTVAVLAFRGLPRARAMADWSLVALVFLDLLSFGSRFNPAGPVAALLPATPGVQFLQEHAGGGRLAVYQTSELMLFGPNLPSIYGIAEAGGYSSVLPARLQQLVKAGDPKTNVPGIARWLSTNDNMVFFYRPSPRLLDLLQVGYFVTPGRRPDPIVRAELLAEGCNGDSGEIAGDRTVGGSFTVRDTHINRLDLRFLVYQPGQAGGTLLARMWRGADHGQQMLEYRLDATRLEDRQDVTLYFAVEREAPGQTYRWQVSAADGVGHTGIGLCTASNGRPAVSVYGEEASGRYEGDASEIYKGEINIYQRLAPPPRASVVYAAETIPDDQAAVQRLLDPSFDLRNTAVIASPIDLPPRADRPSEPAEIASYRDARVVLKASASRPGLLVLADQYHPGWQAYLDGRLAPLLRVNQIQRGVRLPPGEHEIVMEFAPASLRTGSLLTFAGILIGILLIAVELLATSRGRATHRRQNPQGREMG